MMKNTFGLAGAAAALFAVVSAQDPDCNAESTACASDATCLGLVSTQPLDTVAIMANTLGAAQWTCLLGGADCGTEQLACLGDAVCAPLLTAEPVDTAGLTGNTLGNAYLTCQMASQPCSAEYAACTAVDACATALAAQDLAAGCAITEGRAYIDCLDDVSCSTPPPAPTPDTSASTNPPPPPPCTAETTACMSDAACSALLAAEPLDTAAIMANTLGNAYLTCSMPCATEHAACTAVDACATALAAEDVAAGCATTEGRAFLVCLNDPEVGSCPPPPPAPTAATSASTYAAPGVMLAFVALLAN